MKKILYFLLFVPVLVLSQNHVKTTAYRVPVTTSVASPTVEQAVVEKVFTDGLGRPLQHIAYKQSGLQKDIITHIYYDDHQRQSREYLPYVSGGSSMEFDEDAKTNTEIYYNKPEYQNTLNPYSEQFYEPSPLNRILKQGAPGNSWAGNPVNDNDNTIKFEYKFNSSNEVKLFKANTTWVSALEYYDISLENSGGTTFYDGNELYKNIIKDENWTSGHRHTTEEFTDKQGRVVLKRTYDSNANINTARHDTYYVYDDYGNLTYVIPPKATDKGAITQNVLDHLCYLYRYDKHNRLVEKKQPGKAWEYIVYDTMDRVAATGPAYSPFTDSEALGWNIIKYDIHGRVALTGWSNQQPATDAGRKSFQNLVDNSQNQYVTRVNSTVDTVPIGYSNNNTYPSDYKLLTVNYYDKYGYTGALAAPTQIEGQNVTSTLKGLPTGSWVRVLTTSSATLAEKTQIFYDQKARPVRVHKQNHLGGYTQTDSKLVDFTGVTEYTVTYHKRLDSDDEVKIEEHFEYTPHGRLEKHTHKINNLAEEVLTYNTYNDLGQLTNKKVGRNQSNPLQSVDYNYNIRGWLTDINNVDNLGDDLFAFKIKYDDPAFLNGGSAKYNGNISETYWRTSTDNTLRKYSYTYDAINRMDWAFYFKPVTSGTDTNYTMSNYDENIRYDKNGNITSLARMGDLDSELDFILIDQLIYTYDAGNRLIKVTDSSNHPEGFNDRNKTGNDYDYDDFGNLTQDLNKEINSITYNHLNLPKKIEFSSSTQNISYLYNALGQKVEKKVPVVSIFEDVFFVTTHYLDGFQYEANLQNLFNPELKFFATSEGYVNVITSPTTGARRFNYVYNYTDHLGNVRLSYTKGTGTNPPVILEENHYYPFGLKHKKYGSVDKDLRCIDENCYEVGIDVLPPETKKPYQYKYNHQEWQDELNLNLYDMPLRDFDPAIGRWTSQDPVTHFSMSPYNGMDNNPVFWADPSGGNAVPMTLMDIFHNSPGGMITWTGNDDGTFSITEHIANEVFENIIQAFNITGTEGGLMGMFGGGGGESYSPTWKERFTWFWNNGTPVGQTINTINTSFSFLTRQMRHIYGPDAISFTTYIEGSFIVGTTANEGMFLMLRGKYAGNLYAIGDYGNLGEGWGTPNMSGGFNAQALYYSGSLSSLGPDTFMGERWSGSFSYDWGFSSGYGVSYAQVGNHFVFGFSSTIGIGISPTVLSGSINWGYTNIITHH